MKFSTQKFQVLRITNRRESSMIQHTSILVRNEEDMMVYTCMI